LTLVTNRVGSVTSTSFRVSFGDRRTFSGPTSPVSSGTLSGHNSTTSGWSAPAAGQATHNPARRETATTNPFMVALPDPGRGECRWVCYQSAPRTTTTRVRRHAPCFENTEAVCVRSRPPRPCAPDRRARQFVEEFDERRDGRFLLADRVGAMA